MKSLDINTNLFTTKYESKDKQINKSLSNAHARDNTKTVAKPNGNSRKCNFFYYN